MDKQNFMAMNLNNSEVLKKPGECVAAAVDVVCTRAQQPRRSAAAVNSRSRALCDRSAAGSAASSSSSTI